MKKVLILFHLIFAAFQLAAQAPQKFSFQGVARSDGKALANATIKLRLTIHSENPAGTVKYQETHTAQTNSAGIFNVMVGAGNITGGEWKMLDWKEYTYFLQVESDVTGGNSYVDLGTTQLASVPFAMYSAEAARWQNGYPVIQRMEFSPDLDANQFTDINDPKLQPYLLPSLSEGPTFIWYPLRGAFRAGNPGTGAWGTDQTGTFSVAFGNETIASGINSASFGFKSNAKNEHAVAMGAHTVASGISSLAMGISTQASGYAATSFGNLTSVPGDLSMAMGLRTLAKAKASLTIGSFNDVSDSPQADFEQLSDRIFQIGNGAQGNERNALTVLRNGNVGIGSNVLNPQFVLDIGSRMRVRHNGGTAGIYLNNSQNLPDGFIGLMNDSEIGLYLGGWQFFVNKNGNAELKGKLTQDSDRRLKRDIFSLTASLHRITRLQGYHYYWRNADKDQSIQTGLIAQEVEALFPELVTTSEKGFKSVNYIGLIPHLIEAIKELKKENGDAQTRLDVLEARLNAMVPASPVVPAPSK